MHKICFTVSLFHASTCFEHMCSSSGGQNCIIQSLVSSHLYVAVHYVMAVIIIIIIIIIFICCNGVVTGGSGYFTCIQNMKLVTTEFKSGGLHEKHVVATWNVGNRLSICL